ncbi:PREDICTED: uncharacterized protein LOC104810954 [Tarenaya hassleriana]|uniref:uncharacterized protein LOC104810954 n=1 Tax=Tarenaya hassleriana TaxID=28532 RepID=UPI00053C39AD|nr:PREDICTED: uncharacterized protein LOC104810954 [Tarenaya hassleriana]
MSIVMGIVESCGFDRGGGGGGSHFPTDPPAKRGGVLVGGGADRWLGSSVSSPSSSSSSSIGTNSDDEEDEDGAKSSSEGGDSGENAAESPYKGPLDMMDSLEEVLPIRRGISKFYSGKSKSFTSLAEAATSVKDITKPENPYSRRRRNLLSHHMWENRTHRSCSHRGGGGICKKPITSAGKSSLAMAMAAAEMMSSGEDSSSGSGSSPTASGSPPRVSHLRVLPPLHPRSKGSFGNLTTSPSPGRGGGFCAWRSYSVVDLPRCFPAAAGGGSGDS